MKTLLAKVVSLASIALLVAGCPLPKSNSAGIDFRAANWSNSSSSHGTIWISGTGWPPGAWIEIWLNREPQKDGRDIVVSQQPRIIGFVIADQYGEFGQAKGSLLIYVGEKFCGDPPPNLNTFLVAKAPAHNIVKFQDGANDIGNAWFTFKPCP